MEERLLAGPLGVEHSFEVRARPEGTGPLVIDVAFDGLVPVAQGKTDRVVLRDGAGRVRAGYRDLVAVDADGRELAARMDVRGAGVALVIDDAGALYPVRVDPLVWVQTAELTASDGAQEDWFGSSVAVSGNVAIVGALEHTVGTNLEQGAAYVFVQDGTTWTQQAELTASDGAVHDWFGSAVAITGDTVIVGAPGRMVGATSYYQGAVYVFVQEGTGWSHQAELTASDGAADDRFGASVAADGATIIVGAPLHAVGPSYQQGAAYVFVQGDGTWTQQSEWPHERWRGGRPLRRIRGNRRCNDHRRRPTARRRRQHRARCGLRVRARGDHLDPAGRASPPATERRKTPSDGPQA